MNNLTIEFIDQGIELTERNYVIAYSDDEVKLEEYEFILYTKLLFNKNTTFRLFNNEIDYNVIVIKQLYNRLLLRIIE
jgi:hypothetical protein